VAESLTGGLIASTLVAVPGASKVFLGGAVAYANSAKVNLLGIPSEVIESYGAVSAATAEAMAQGIRSHLSSDGDPAAPPLLTISTTGVAGPESQDGQPVGTVFIGITGPHGVSTQQFAFSGDRQSVRNQTTRAALILLRDEIPRHLGLVTV
jgi:nicotinamide-nucleotide amidase